jgi:hypothetical protein
VLLLCHASGVRYLISLPLFFMIADLYGSAVVASVAATFIGMMLLTCSALF